MSHYRKSLVFSYENLDNAKISYEKLISRIAKLVETNDGSEVDADMFEKLKTDFTSAMDNDLNTSLAVTALYNVLKSDANNATKLALISDFDKVLSLSLIEKSKEYNNNENVSETDDADKDFVAAVEEALGAPYCR